MKRIYIAHPLIGTPGDPLWGDRDRNLDRYLRICARATEQGHVVLSWVHHVLLHDAGLTCTDGQDEHDYYLVRDEALVAVADEVWQCCPNGVSRGVDREVAFAKDEGIPVVCQPYMTQPGWAGRQAGQMGPAPRPWSAQRNAR